MEVQSQESVLLQAKSVIDELRRAHQQEKAKLVKAWDAERALMQAKHAAGQEERAKHWEHSVKMLSVQLQKTQAQLAVANTQLAVKSKRLQRLSRAGSVAGKCDEERAGRRTSQGHARTQTLKETQSNIDREREESKEKENWRPTVQRRVRGGCDSAVVSVCEPSPQQPELADEVDRLAAALKAAEAQTAAVTAKLNQEEKIQARWKAKYKALRSAEEVEAVKGGLCLSQWKHLYITANERVQILQAECDRKRKGLALLESSLDTQGQQLRRLRKHGQRQHLDNMQQIHLLQQFLKRASA